MSTADSDQPVRVIENTWITMADGCRLAAQIWLPEDAEAHPVPAVLEYIPYRKRDHKALRDAEIHGFFAAQGFAGVRVDIRGSGDSEGILRDEYLQQELDDGLEILSWIAAQPWCSGKVGLFGLSWGGFNGLQLAALQPPELGAVISVCSSDDRYADDVHYMGGCLLTDNLSWASTMFGFNSCPPDPLVVGERWRDMWLERLEGSGLWIHNWLQHQRRDDFWRHASVCEDYDAIQVPVMAVSGWADGYSNTVFRLMRHLKGPRRGLVGPWGHKYPHMGGPGPTIDFLGECVRWWDHWLKGIDRQVEQDPMLRVWMHDRRNPLLPETTGGWVAEPHWPSPAIRSREYHLHNGRLVPAEDDMGESDTVTIQSPLSVGLFAGKWCSYAEITDLPSDQRLEDGGALVFDTQPLEEDVQMLGAAEMDLEISADKPVAMVAVRISELAPDDRATRVTFGILNLTHRENHENPTELEPGRPYPVTVRLNEVAQRFRAGHRIRVAVSSSYWPLAWPAPEPVRLTLHTGGCRLRLPERRSDTDDAALPSLGQPRQAPTPPNTLLAPAHREWNVIHNLATNQVALDVVNNDPRLRLDDIDLSFGRQVHERYSYSNERYDTLRGEVTHERHFGRGDWEVRTVTRTVLTSTRTRFVIRATLDAYEGDVRVFSKTWDETVPRDLV
ncbi:MULTISPECIES: CocE/NonD family hydrolase [unclassified Ectothiorhodospira]|uniref:CocE/NonD family hydrolase n=1 Tax=unclassified Ectothiorhodospira TaxID=2684909 RepID=UPI001EE84427|nr:MULTISPECIES: CocE/NonD family hydrolase [unclassified Ectothiorhodospira]MCG5514528.1 CocE/NonD family hydrolase [Ectothiorhodospira sp. 9100]MCG5518668.1 CocE/NonD family hydrolase [Ectothiorhodospira sp. 9905]